MYTTERETYSLVVMHNQCNLPDLIPGGDRRFSSSCDTVFRSVWVFSTTSFCFCSSLGGWNIFPVSTDVPVHMYLEGGERGERRRGRGGRGRGGGRREERGRKEGERKARGQRREQGRRKGEMREEERREKGRRQEFVVKTPNVQQNYLFFCCNSSKLLTTQLYLIIAHTSPQMKCLHDCDMFSVWLHWLVTQNHAWWWNGSFHFLASFQEYGGFQSAKNGQYTGNTSKTIYHRWVSLSEHAVLSWHTNHG